MSTERNGTPIVFQVHGRREVRASFDGGRLSPDGGALLLREADNVFGVSGRLAGCFSDHRDPERSEHERDRGHPLASSSTLNRLEPGIPDRAAGDRCKRISAGPAAIDRLPVAPFLEAHGTAPGKGATSTRIATVTAACRFVSPAANMCCAAACGRRASTRRRARLTSWSGSSRRSARRGRRCGSWCGGIRASAARRSWPGARRTR